MLPGEAGHWVSIYRYLLSSSVVINFPQAAKGEMQEDGDQILLEARIVKKQCQEVKKITSSR